jgi:hypothetical protein
MKFYVRKEVWTDGVQLYVIQDNDGFRRPVTFTLNIGEPIEKGMVIPSASWEMTGREAQMLIDALWEGGLRPHDGNGSGAQVEAMKAHLEDMRKLVFK